MRSHITLAIAILSAFFPMFVAVPSMLAPIRAEPIMMVPPEVAQAASVAPEYDENNSTASASQEIEAIRDQLLNGVSSLADPTQPGHMVVYGANAYRVADYQTSGEIGPMIAAATWEQGKVIALPDHQWLNMDRYSNEGDSGQFYLNGLAWLSGTTSKEIKIVVTPHTAAKSWLEGQGFTNVTQSGDYASALQDADLLVGWLGSSVSQSDLDLIANFVKNGGGLFLADYGVGYSWWWNKPTPEAPGNILLREIGIGFTKNWSYDGSAINPVNRATGHLTSDDVLQMLDDSSTFTAQELQDGAIMLDGMYQVLAEGDALLTQLDTTFFARIDQISPTPNTPVSDGFEKALLKREATLLGAVPVADVTPHRTVDALYGTIPVATPRVTESITLDTQKSRWHATGLFAAPGEVVRVTVPESLVGKGYKVRINAHTDNISPRGTWERPPVVHRAFTIDQATTDVASAFGGLLFIDLGNTPLNLGEIQITIQNAVEAPYFVLNQHTDEAWLNSLRSRPAPYSVLVSDNLILSVPTEYITELEEPTALMTWWNQVVALQDELADQAQFRTSPELINVDIQNSAGAAHAGFPIQAYRKHWGNPANWEHLSTTGSWGDYHELGHNLQRGWWTFSGDTEVTVNIFSNYALEQMPSNSSSGWAWSADPVQVIQHAISDVEPGGSYSSKSNRWSFWFQLADGFGWEAYQNVFQAYEADAANNPENLPKNEQEKKDQWLVRFSQEVGYDMTPFMRDTWGLQVSQAAVDQISDLPDWMPVVGGLPDVTIARGMSHTFDIGAHAYSMDGVANLTDITPSAHGSLTDNGNGTYLYTPEATFVGVDAFDYTLQSSAGNTQTFSVEINVTDLGILMETWHNIDGSSISDLTSASTYPEQPDEVAVSSDFESPTNQANNYGVRMRAYLIAPATGSYKFWIASDDQGQLWLSSDRNPTNASQMAHVPVWTSARQWDKYPEQESESIELVAGDAYYIEALMKEGGGGDNLAIAWQGPGIEQQVITNEHLRVVDVNATFPQLQHGVLNDVGSADWTTVTLPHSYQSMVVVTTPVYTYDEAPLVTRIRNASGNRFEIKVQRLDGQTEAITGIQVQYMVVEEGVYTQEGHGITMEAVKMTSSVTDSHADGWQGEEQAYSNSYSQPVVLGQVMSDNDLNPSVFWARGGRRGKIPTNSKLFVGKHVGQDSNTSRANETIGYIVIEAGNGTLDGVPYEVGVGEDIVRGIQNDTYSYQMSHISHATTAILSSAAMDGGDGGHPILVGNNAVAGNTIMLAIDEDQLTDNERRHTTEQVAYIVFGQ